VLLPLHDFGFFMNVRRETRETLADMVFLAAKLASSGIERKHTP